MDQDQPREITKKEWEAACRHGYTSVVDGRALILSLDRKTGAMTLEPVRVVGHA